MEQIYDRVAALLPNLLVAAALLLAGWLAARLLRALTVRGVGLLETLVARRARASGDERPRATRSGAALGAIVFWSVLLLFAGAATLALGLDAFTRWLGRVLDYLPTLAAGVLIAGAGYVLAGIVADLVRAAARRLAPAQQAALARLAQGVTLVAAILIGADQIGIEVTWLAVFSAIVVGSLLGGLTIAASLGARGYVSNLIGAHYLAQAFEVGQRLRIAGHEGRVLRFTATSIVLETSDGRVSLPGRVFHEEPIVLLTGTDGGSR
jgi:small-conductance mechanosensitive channel